jgi:hypothetical protein
MLGRATVPLNFAVTPLNTWVNVVTLTVALPTARDVMVVARVTGQAAGTNGDNWLDINVNGTRFDVGQTQRAAAGLAAMSGVVPVLGMPAGTNTVILRAYTTGGYTIGSGEVAAFGFGADPAFGLAVASVGPTPPANPIIGQLWIDTS